MTTTTDQRLVAADYLLHDQLQVGDRIALVRSGRVGFYRIKGIPANQTDPVWFEVKLAAWPASELLRRDGLYPVERGER
jgi:hypothetical protein